MLPIPEEIASPRAKGLWLFQQGYVAAQERGTYQVISQSDPQKTYTVTPKTKSTPPHCTCAFFLYQKQICKHLFAAEFAFLFCRSVSLRIAQLSLSFSTPRKGGQYETPPPKEPGCPPWVDMFLYQIRRLLQDRGRHV